MTETQSAIRTRPVVIGIAGKAGAGKDTVGAHLQSLMGYRTVAFADPIRRGVLAILGLPTEHLTHPAKEQALPLIGKSPRELMQTLGTEWGRNLVHQNLWVILAGGTIQAHFAAGKNVAVTDVRFENEAAMIRRMGGAIWHIGRSSAGTPHAHVSETGIEFRAGDVFIDNNGSIEDLHAAVEKKVGAQ